VGGVGFRLTTTPFSFLRFEVRSGFFISRNVSGRTTTSSSATSSSESSLGKTSRTRYISIDCIKTSGSGSCCCQASAWLTSPLYMGIRGSCLPFLSLFFSFFFFFFSVLLSFPLLFFFLFLSWPLGWAAGPGRWAAGLGRWAACPLGRWAACPLGRWAACPLVRWSDLLAASQRTLKKKRQDILSRVERYYTGQGDKYIRRETASGLPDT
jgi:hypothetical protein